MLLLLLVVIVLAVVAYVYRKQIQLAYQNRRLSNAIKSAQDAIASHEAEAAAKAKAIIADARGIIARLETEIAGK
jgi:uncharacterized protein HemX